MGYDRLLSAAHHEAGHAVGMLAAGVGCRGIDLTPDDGSGSCEAWHDAPDPFTHACYIAAGVVAQCVHEGGRVEWGRPRPPWRGDMSRLAELLEGDAVRIRKAFVLAEQLVRQNWTAITSIAKLLAERRQLSSDDIATCVSL